MNATLDVRPLTGYIGAELTGYDLGQLNDADLETVKEAFVEHQVLFFRRQTLSPESLLALARRFGRIETPHPALKTLPGHPDIFLVETRDGQGVGKYNTNWHTDVSFDATPPAASIIQAVLVPEVGGDTLFASMYAAYDNLSERVRLMIDGLEALHDGVARFRSQMTAPEDQGRLDELQRRYPGAIHPVVRRHPSTGRKALYVNRSFTTRIMGLSEVENRNVLSLLFDQAEQSSYQVRWAWQPGDVAVWDNRCAMHCASWDYGMSHRVMHRVTISGDKPV